MKDCCDTSNNKQQNKTISFGQIDPCQYIFSSWFIGTYVASIWVHRRSEGLTEMAKRVLA